MSNPPSNIHPSPGSLTVTDMEYPAWCRDEEVPITKKELREIFDDLTVKFGFQNSSCDNMYHHLLSQLDSRASRTSSINALRSLHVSYIGGEISNFKKWFFAAQLDLDEEIGFSNLKLTGKSKKRNKKFAKKNGIEIKKQMKNWQLEQDDFLKNNPIYFSNNKNFKNNNNNNNNINQKKNFNKKDIWKIANYKWNFKMSKLNDYMMARQLALYLLIWGESNNIRFAPECICFIFKCAMDYDNSTLLDDFYSNSTPEFNFLNNIITPLYDFLKNQIYKIDTKNKKNWIRNEKDHKDIIGYDDINQLFWYPEGIESIILNDGTRLIDLPIPERYLYLKDVNWKKVFYKTYRESRSWLHSITNFNRFWIIHFASFWFFTSLNTPVLYTQNYNQLLNNPPTPQVKLTIVAFGGTISCLIQIFATFLEWSYVPRKWPGCQHLTMRMIGLILCLIINVLPTIYIIGRFGFKIISHHAYIISIVQLVIAILTTIFFATRPLGGMFGSYLNKHWKKRKYVSSQTFTASFPKLKGRSRWFSYGLWFFVFSSKFVESYFFLTLSVRDPIRVLFILDMSRCGGDRLIGNFLCKLQPFITLFLMIFTDLALFFLDTYLWYIICNSIFSIILSFSLGTSILTPWKNIYSRLPKRINSKILATSEMDIKYKPKILTSQIWNAIIISMYREHLLSIEHAKRLLFQQVETVLIDKRTLKSPTFFVAQDDSTFKTTEFFVSDSEAQRRISFFAQSLSTPIAEPLPVECMPSFTVLIPHYSEKILLSLKELIKEESINARITVLEYLKELHPFEWEYFVKDTKMIHMEQQNLNEINSSFKMGNDKFPLIDSDQQKVSASIHDSNKSSDQRKSIVPQLEEASMKSTSLSQLSNTLNKELSSSSMIEHIIKNRINDLPYYFYGFKSSDTLYTLRTRIWSSLRTQTLYRTITGFMNYAKALKLLHKIENPSLTQIYGQDIEGIETFLDNLSNRKFKMLIAMQRYPQFNAEEKEATEFLLKNYPYLNISYLLEEKDENENSFFYSCLTNGFQKIDEETGLRIPIFKIRLSGNPILGDGKSDNQNHSLIFYRGEYIQVVDANQDNYLEECLKIRSVLNEFEEFTIDATMPYVPGIDSDVTYNPVAIVGAREYIFSENIGVLGDIAAGKEQTFGTLFARTLAEIGGKLHYGHPDFINAIFMTTRGGLSKAQKSLHLNEDIYAGINAICRGGRIKHSDYYQCGKGRDLGFGSILNFTTKIGAGMGEQLLSREYYYLGTQLPIDRFLSFFYAHPGFHLNNVFIALALQLFFLLLMNLGALNYETITCIYNKNNPITHLEEPIGCYNIQPALNWVSIFVLSIFIVFFIAFAPLLILELLEKGVWKATTRFLHHLFSMAPLFEVFACQVYSNSLLSDISFGGAKYISTGRGFAIQRISFPILYSRFVTVSIYSGFQIFMMLIFATLTMWQPALLWFWITVISMCFAPFIFNPHQFSFTEFFLDYKNYLHWLFSGNAKYKEESWATFTKHSRAKYTGYKDKLINHASEKGVKDTKRPRFFNLLFLELFSPLFVLCFNFTCYTFINAQTGVKNPFLTHSIFRLLLVSAFPVAFNMTLTLILFNLSVIIIPILSYCCFRAGNLVAFISHMMSVIIYLINFELMWFLEKWNCARTLALLITSINLQTFVFKVITIFGLPREYKNNQPNKAWWTGHWYRTGMGASIFSQPFREYIVKIMESSFFAGDFFLGHILLFLQTPVIFIPFIDYWHSMILFWLKPINMITTKKIYTRRERKKRHNIIKKYFFIYFLILILLVFSICWIPIFSDFFMLDVDTLIDRNKIVKSFFQPNEQFNNDTGVNAPSTILTTTPQMPVFKTVN